MLTRFAKLTVLASMLTPRYNPLVAPHLTTKQMYGLFSNTEDVSVDFTVVGKYVGASLTINYYNAKYNSLQAHEETRLTSKNFTYILRTKYKLSDDGLRVVFIIDNETDYVEQVITIYPTSNQEIYSYQYRDNPFICYNRCFEIAGEDYVINYEKYSFDNTIDYLTNSIDNTLELDEIVFSYNNGKTLINKDIDKYLMFKDIYDLFPYLETDSNGYKKVPIKCVQNKSEISFRYLQSMYYEPSTYQMSLTSRNGFIETNSFYLPKTSISLLELYDFQIFMPTFGYSGVTVHIPLTFYKDKNFAGLCSNSNYCIVGGLKE